MTFFSFFLFLLFYKACNKLVLNFCNATHLEEKIILDKASFLLPTRVDLQGANLLVMMHPSVLVVKKKIVDLLCLVFSLFVE